MVVGHSSSSTSGFITFKLAIIGRFLLIAFYNSLDGRLYYCFPVKQGIRSQSFFHDFLGPVFNFKVFLELSRKELPFQEFFRQSVATMFHTKITGAVVMTVFDF